MMKVRILLLLFLGLIGAEVCNAAPLNSNEQEAITFVENSSSTMFDYYNNMCKNLFDTDENNIEEILNSLKTIVTTADKMVEIVNKSKEFDVSKFNDPGLKYIFKIIRRSADEAVLGHQKFIEIFFAMNMLQELATDKDVPAFHNKSIDLAFYPDIQNIYAKSNDPEELKYYWTTWRDKNGAWAVANFVNLIKGLKEAARLTDITPLEYWLEEYKIDDMEKVLMQIEPLYIQLHGFIRKQLHKKYGDSVISLNGPIPHHLFEQVLAQAWTSGSVIDEMYPHKDLPPYDDILKKNNFDTLKMFKTADKFYQSLGFTPIPDEYWGQRFRMNTDDDEGDCKPTILDMSPEVYMRYCQKMDFRKFLQAHGYMGELYYAREKTSLPSYYFEAHDLQFPVGEAVILSASTPKHLDTIGLVSDFSFTEDVKMNRHLRMGIHTFLNIPVYFVHTKAMADLFDGSVDIHDLNKHFWKLMDKYVGVAPPVDRGSDAYDFPFKFYTDLSENKQAKKFMTEVLGYQFYEKLCEISGQYSRSTKSEPINNCDFYGSKEAGDALKKMMRLGSSKPMRDVLATMFPENPTVNAESLIQYYAPMKSWLTKMIQENGVIVGWSHSDKKVSALEFKEDDDDE